LQWWRCSNRVFAQHIQRLSVFAQIGAFAW
jgi:hypothetical protein